MSRTMVKVRFLVLHELEGVVPAVLLGELCAAEAAVEDQQMHVECCWMTDEDPGDGLLLAEARYGAARARVVRWLELLGVRCAQWT